jgi:lysophospholipase L1-like esterase
MWKDIQKDFTGYKVINRGFGGSTLPDVIRYVNDIVFPYHPKQVIIYCGENDLAESDTVSAATVTERFKNLFSLIRTKWRKVPIVFISIKPSPSRQYLMPKMVEANQQIKEFLDTQRRTKYIDVYSLMLTADGKPNAELFIEDQLHMNAKGYAIWKKAIEPYLKK